MSDLGPGDIVVCVKWESDHFGYVEAILKRHGLCLTVGALYQVEQLYADKKRRCPWDDCGHIGVKLVGKRMGRWALYCPNLFRKPSEYYCEAVSDDLEENLKDTPKILEPV